jgi:hypothetical protein
LVKGLAGGNERCFDVAIWRQAHRTKTLKDGLGRVSKTITKIESIQKQQKALANYSSLSAPNEWFELDL